MRNRVPAVVLAVALVSGLALLAAPAAASGKPVKVTRLAATLSGANEIPGPGDPDGRGRPSSGWPATRPATRSSGRGSAPRRPPTSTRAGPGRPARWWCCSSSRAPTRPRCRARSASVAGCVDVDPAAAREIAASPRDWYVNIHTADFVPGAIRGQLHRSRHLDLDLPRQLVAGLNGANEFPGPGDPDGRGLGLVRTGRERVCFALGWSGIAPPIFAHIHTGVAGVAGPVVVLFFDVPELAGAPTAALPATVAAAGGCVGDQDPALLRDIRRQPAAYYVNIHTLEFVPGAIRGQLRQLA